MNILKKCCYRSLRENRKRTIVTVIGVILATALITGVACMAVSFRKSMIAYEIQKNGNYHYAFMGVAPENLKYFENNQQVERIALVEELGYAWLEGVQNPDKPYLFIAGLGDAAEEALSLHLTQGRMPETDEELVIGSHIRSNGLLDLKVGDVLTLQVGDRISEGYKLSQGTGYLYEEEQMIPEYEKTYTIVGIIQRPGSETEPYHAPGYSAYTRMGDPGEAQEVNVYASYTKRGLKHLDQVTAGLLGVSEELYRRYYGFRGGLGTYTEQEREQIRSVAKRVEENYWVLKWEVMIFASSTISMLYAMAAIAIVIIVVTGIFCIHNSFVISLTEKMKLYGRLSSVGTTSRQQRKIVYYEAVFLGGLGIPLGILSGVGATAVLVKAVGGLVKDAAGFTLCFGVSFSAILLAAALSAVTVFFSAYRSARKAGKLSPIRAIRANDTVRIRKRELRCPKIIGKMFGIGGRIAYKNLRRARVKYRTTVISIVVSVSVFIGMSTFVGLLFDINGIYNERLPYQMRVSVNDYEEALKIAALEGVSEAEIVRSADFLADVNGIPFTEEYHEHGHLPDKEMQERLREEGINFDEGIQIRSLGTEGYERYCKKVGVSPEEAGDKAIVTANFSDRHMEEGRIIVDSYRIAEFKKGDVIRGTGDEGGQVKIPVVVQTDELPMYLQGVSYNSILLIVNEEYMSGLPDSLKSGVTDIYIKCEDADRLEEIIRSDMPLQNYTLTNYDAFYRADRSLYLVIAIFLYGFITVVALIGITNIFNTITTNMELRGPEFAMLRSVGMTGREFRRMIWLEGMFYGGRALLTGIPLGLLLSWFFNLAMREGIVSDFLFPWNGILISVAAVAVLLFAIMHYSMAKINRKNIIETIQNENI